MTMTFKDAYIRVMCICKLEAFCFYSDIFHKGITVIINFEHDVCEETCVMNATECLCLINNDY